MNNASFQALIQSFFLRRLMQQRKVSEKTVSSYRDTFRIYLEFLKTMYGKSAEAVTIEYLSREYLQDFCVYLEGTRLNGASTINNRLAAIRSFLRYVLAECPEYSNIVRGSLMVPFRKQERATMDFITKNEFEAITRQCDLYTAIGARDKMMLMLLYNSGMRVSELLSLKYSDVKNLEDPRHASLKIYGKGRKERMVPLWKITAKYITKYTETFGMSGQDSLFINKNGDKLTRSGVRSRIDILVKLASVEVPSLLDKNITPHTFRHSVAMNLLTSGVDLSTIALWLGHSSIETTHKYMVADIELKRNAMDKAGSVGNASYRYKPSKDILAFLNNL